MKRLLDLVAMTIGGWLGWTAGSWISVFTAFLLSVIGTGMALYAARKFTKRFLP